MAKITMEIGGKYSAGQAFQKAQDATKKIGQEAKDAASIGQNAFSGLADVVGGKTATAFNALSGSIQAFTTGGIFGVVATLGKMAFDAVSDAIARAQENVVRLYDYIASMTPKTTDSLTEGTSKVAKEVAEAEANVQKLIATSNGKITGTVQNNVARLNVEGLQKVTDGMTEASKKALEAQTAYNIKMEQMNGEVEKASSALTIWRQASEQLNTRNTEINDELNKLKVMEASLAQRHNAHLLNLLNYEKQNDEGKKAIDEEGKSIEAERNRLVKIRTTLEDASNKNKEQIIEFEKKEFEAQLALQTAEAMRTEAELQYTNEVNVRIEQERKAAMTAQRKADAAELEFAMMEERDKWEDKIVKQLKEQNLQTEERLALMEVVKQSLEDGLEDAEIEGELRKKWLELMKERNENVEKENDDTANGKLSKSNSGASMTVSLDNSATSDIGEQVEEHQNFKEWQHKQRDELRKGRNQRNEMKQDMPAMTKALKGEMPQAQAEAWIKYAKQKYTPNQMTELANMARKTQLMSTGSKEWRDQQDRFRAMLSCLKGEDEASKKRNEAIKKTEEHTKKVAEFISKAAMS